MPRAKSKNRNELVDSALYTFWRGGYSATSMGDLVRETGVSRSGIYADFGGKDELFRTCLDRYQDEIVSFAFGVVEEEGAGFEAIERYFATILSMAEAIKGPDIGCLVANSLGQVAPDDDRTQALLDAHGERLKAGFRAVLTRENEARGRLSAEEIDKLAAFSMVSVQGLWAYMRNKSDLDIIRDHADMLMTLLRSRIG